MGGHPVWVKLKEEMCLQDTRCLYALLEFEPKLIVMQIFSPSRKKTPAKFQKDPTKTVGGVAFTKYPVSKCLKPKNDYVQTAKKVNLRITTKCHAHLQTLKKNTCKV